MLQEHGLESRQRRGPCPQARGDDLFVTLDSDGAVGGDVLGRLVCLVSSMEKHPRTGLPQTQFAGMPAAGSFTRLLQFGMRHNVPVHNVATWKFLLDPQRHHPHRRLPQAPHAPRRDGKATRLIRRHFSTSCAVSTAGVRVPCSTGFCSRGPACSPSVTSRCARSSPRIPARPLVFCG